MHTLCPQNNTPTKKEHPCLTLGPSVPSEDYLPTCMYYFNINGNFNDKSQIYLVAFVKDIKNKTNKNIILKNNEWIEHFNNHEKLRFPKLNQFFNFGCDFMVCDCNCFVFLGKHAFFYFCCVFKKITYFTPKKKHTQSQRHKQKSSAKHKNNI